MTSLDMTSDAVLREIAEAYAGQGKWTAALAAFEELRARRPGDADVLLQLSYVCSLSGHYRAARDWALRAAHAPVPRELHTIRELATRLRTFNEAGVLRAYVERLGPLGRWPVPLLIVFAAEFDNLNEQATAIRLLDAASKRDRSHPQTLAARAQVLIHLGRFDEARRELLACAHAAPRLARAWWLLAGLGKQTREANHVEAIRAELARPGRHPEEVVELASALHRSLDDLGQYEAAWDALELACRTKRAQLDYRREDSQALIDALIATFPAPQPARSVSAGAPVPIFIVGLHRSGTTLMEQILSGHSRVRGLGELYDFTSALRDATDHHCRGVIDLELVRRLPGVDFVGLGARYLDGLAWRLRGAGVFTDKLPSNFLHLGAICWALPHARIVHMRRAPMDVCFSNLRETFSEANPYSYDQDEMAHFHGQYRRLMAHWQRVCAGRILDVALDDLVADPEATTRTVAAFCGLEFEPAMLDVAARRRAVSTASAVSARQGIAAEVQTAWTPYAAHLGRLAAGLSGQTA